MGLGRQDDAGLFLFKKAEALNLLANFLYQLEIILVKLYGNALFSGSDNNPQKTEVIGTGKGDNEVHFRSGWEQVLGFDENTATTDVKDVFPVFLILGIIGYGAEIILADIPAFFSEVVHNRTPYEKGGKEKWGDPLKKSPRSNRKGGKKGGVRR